MISRRSLVVGGAATAGLAVASAATWELAPGRLGRRLHPGPASSIPDAAEGVVRLERLRSKAMGAEVDVFTAVPAGHGDGAGLPVVVVLHGASASAADFGRFGLARFLTAAVERGAAPFVLAGTDDGPAGWVPDRGSAVDPQAMVLEELPAWLSTRGFDARRRGLWGWSRGGYGALRLAEKDPGWARAAALFSPAVVAGDEVYDGLRALTSLPLGVGAVRATRSSTACTGWSTSCPGDPRWRRSQRALTRGPSGTARRSPPSPGSPVTCDGTPAAPVAVRVRCQLPWGEPGGRQRQGAQS